MQAPDSFVQKGHDLIVDSDSGSFAKVIYMDYRNVSEQAVDKVRFVFSEQNGKVFQHS